MNGVIDKHWSVELIYHIQLLKSSEDLNPEWTDNIFRLNIKWMLTHKSMERLHIHLALKIKAAVPAGFAQKYLESIKLFAPNPDA